MFSAVAPLLVLPVVIGFIGTQGWVGLAIGYGVGSAASILVALGWSFSGPAQVARAEPAVCRALYWESVVVRSAMWPIASLLGCLASVYLAPDGHRTLACLMTAATASWGLTPNWFFVGTGRARGIVRYETGPRLAATLVTVPVLLLTGWAAAYPLLIAAGSMVGVVGATREILDGRGRPAFLPGLKTRMIENLLLALSVALGAGYTSLAVPLAQLSGTGLREVADLAGASRLRTLSQFGTASVTTALQGWVAEPSREAERRARQRNGLAITTLTGVPIALGLILIGPPLSALLFRGASSLSLSLAIAIAAGCVPYAASSSLTFHWLAPAGKGRAVATSRILASAVGIPMVYFGARYAGAVGAAWAMTASELVNAMCQASIALRMRCSAAVRTSD